MRKRGAVLHVSLREHSIVVLELLCVELIRGAHFLQLLLERLFWKKTKGASRKKMFRMGTWPRRTPAEYLDGRWHESELVRSPFLGPYSRQIISKGTRPAVRLVLLLDAPCPARLSVTTAVPCFATQTDHLQIDHVYHPVRHLPL